MIGVPGISTLIMLAVVAVSLRRALFLAAVISPPRPLPSAPRSLPTLSLLVPARNEAAVAARLLRGIGKLDYPIGKLQVVLVCNGCCDATPSSFRRWSQGRPGVEVLELPHPGKAAALNAGLRRSRGEYLVVLDADLDPLADLLKELIRPFGDPRVGAAAAYLRPSNAGRNLVSLYAALNDWVHQLVTSAGKDRLRLNPPTLGAAAFRRTALLACGGFPDVPSGEDVAIGIALVRQGWQTRFVPTAIADNTVCERLGDVWRQRVRWNRGTATAHGAGRGARRWGDRRSWGQRLEEIAAASGCADRLIFALALAGAALGWVPLWVPLLYLLVPSFGSALALHRGASLVGLPRVLLALLCLFPLDAAAAATAMVRHSLQRPHRWLSPRRITEPPTGER
ncbi:MAG: glycosyltransferase family 2 protein [Synechococcaceae cyanobacterium]|nr:glycosyltransferase family 2 protein [Synechococcaceae cyanobacterium]